MTSNTSLTETKKHPRISIQYQYVIKIYQHFKSMNHRTTGNTESPYMSRTSKMLLASAMERANPGLKLLREPDTPAVKNIKRLTKAGIILALGLLTFEIGQCINEEASKPPAVHIEPLQKQNTPQPKIENNTAPLPQNPFREKLKSIIKKPA